MAKKENKEVEKASKVLETMSMDYYERWAYDARKFKEWDERSLKEYEMEEATKKGEKMAKLEDARKMLKEGIKIETVIRITGLTKEEIMNVK